MRKGDRPGQLRGLADMKVDNVKLQVVLFVFHVPRDRGTGFSTIQVQAQLDSYRYWKENKACKTVVYLSP